jgi:ribosomal protein L37AE/L43A
MNTAFASSTSMNLAPAASGQLLDTAACPLCHTAISSATALSAWECRTCGQRWTARRLATVASYTAWVEARERPRDGTTQTKPTGNPNP